MGVVGWRWRQTAAPARGERTGRAPRAAVKWDACGWKRQACAQPLHALVAHAHGLAHGPAQRLDDLRIAVQRAVIEELCERAPRRDGLAQLVLAPLAAYAQRADPAQQFALSLGPSHASYPPIPSKDLATDSSPSWKVRPICSKASASRERDDAYCERAPW